MLYGHFVKMATVSIEFMEAIIFLSIRTEKSVFLFPFTKELPLASAYSANR